MKKTKNLLVVDNYLAHPIIENLTNIKLVFFPPNTTSILQPYVDLDFIKSLKGFCKRFVAIHLIARREPNLDVPITFLDAINFLFDAQNNVMTVTKQRCFRKSKLSTLTFLKRTNFRYQRGINNVDLDEYQHIDDDLITSRIPTENEIINTLLQKDDDDEDDKEEDAAGMLDLPEPSLPSLFNAENACNTLMTFFQGNDAKKKKKKTQVANCLAVDCKV